MEEKKEKKNLAYRLGQLFAVTIMLSLIALTIGVTVKLLTLIF